MGSYDRYLGRLQEQLNDRYILDNATKKLRYQKADFDKQSEDLHQDLGRRGTPAAAMADISMEQTQEWQRHSGKVFSEAEFADTSRRKGIQGKIEDVEFQKEEYDRRKKAEKKAKEKAKSGFLWRTLGTAAGAAVGSLIPGGTLAGAKIGGGLASTVIGLDDSYETPELIEQGIGETLGGIVQTAGILEDQEFAGFLGDVRERVMGMDDRERALTLDELRIDQENMSFKDFKSKWGHLLPDMELDLPGDTIEL